MKREGLKCPATVQRVQRVWIGAVKKEMTQIPLRLTVISTVAGQPTIGKPLIGQAREALINSQSLLL